MSASKVRVCVRCRPLSMKEARGRRCVSITNDKVAVGDKIFAFDGVFDESSTQPEVYDGCVSRLTEGCLQGFNATILAYGQTGSGKTHSVMGNGSEGDDEEGIIPRVARHMFDILDSKTINSDGKVVASLHVSFIEIYNDECKDLLHPDIQPRDIYIREDKEGKIFFTGAREEQVTSAEAVLELLDRGNMSRTTAETFMNATSSRSHAIFTISIEIYDYSAPLAALEDDNEVVVASGPMERGGSYIQSKIHLVDLAGSERAKKTGAGGQRLKESVGINQGLLSLGKVIRALTTPAPKGGASQTTHVPYRESKLTRFLQDSLGGNSRTVMLACISPAESNLHETLSTLQYAFRARAVQNKVVANVAVGIGGGPLDALAAAVGGDSGQDGIVSMLRAQLSKMQEEMQLLRRTGGSGGAGRLLGAIEEGDEDNRDDDQKSSNHLLRRTTGKATAAVGAAAAAGGDSSNAVTAGEAAVAVEELEKRLGSLMKVASQAAYSIQKTLKSMGKVAESPETSGPAWPLIQACQVASSRLSYVVKDCESGLEQILGHEFDYSSSAAGGSSEQLRASTSIMRRSLADTLNEMARDEEARTLRRELEECREDLQRDEEIFAEKVRELKSYRKKLRQLEKDNAELQEKIEDANRDRDQQWQMRTTTATTITAAGVGGYFSSPMKSPAAVAVRARRGGGLGETMSVRRSQVDIRWEDDDNDHRPRPVTPKAKTPSPVKRLLLGSGGGGGEGGREGGGEGGGNDTIPDDLEISMVVAATEPDISHLIEDLETMAREKDELLREREQEKDRLNSSSRPSTAKNNNSSNSTSTRAEDKDGSYSHPFSPQKAVGYNSNVRPLSAVATSTSSLQAEDKLEYSQQTKIARKRLAELQSSISNKQQLLTQIAAAKTEAEASISGNNDTRAAALDQECSSLHRELRDLEASRRRIGEEAGQERERRISLEVMLKNAEDERLQLESDRDAVVTVAVQRAQREAREKQREEDETAARVHVEELRQLREEYARLLLQVEEDERRQRENVQSLTHQMSEYKQTTIDAEGQVTMLTKRASELEQENDDLFQQLKQKQLQEEDQEQRLLIIQQQWDEERQRLLKNIRDLEQLGPTVGADNLQGRGEDGGDKYGGGDVNNEIVAMAAEEMWAWLKDRIEQLAAVNITSAEMSRLKELSSNTRQELLQLKDEEAKLRKQLESGQESLAKQHAEIEGRIDKLSVQLHERQEVISEVREELAACRDDDQRRQTLIQELATMEARASEAHKHLKSYKAHREEIADRLKKGILAPEAAQRFLEIQDEIETMETEYAHTANLLSKEVDSLQQLYHDLRITSTASDTNIDTHVNTHVNTVPTAATSTEAIEAVTEQLSRRLSTALIAASYHSSSQTSSLPHPPPTNGGSITNTAAATATAAALSSRPSQLPHRKTSRGSESKSPGDEATATPAPPDAPPQALSGKKITSVKTETLVQQLLLSKLTQSLAEAKSRLQRDDGEVESLRVQLDERSTALEEQMSTAQKTRLEYLGKLEQQRKEGEDKVAYLLQQLRIVEGKLVTSRSQSRAQTPSSTTPSTTSAAASKAAAQSGESKRSSSRSGSRYDHQGTTHTNTEEGGESKINNARDNSQEEEEDEAGELASFSRFSHSVNLNRNMTSVSRDDDVLLWTKEAGGGSSYSTGSRPATPAAAIGGLTVGVNSSSAVTANTFSPRSNTDAAAALAVQLRRLSDNELSKSLQTIKSPRSLSRPGSALVAVSSSRPPTAAGQRAPPLTATTIATTAAATTIATTATAAGDDDDGDDEAIYSTIVPEVEQGVREEVVRRWQAEKERREMLEKRSSDLVKKLRAMKVKEVQRDKENNGKVKGQEDKRGEQ